ncbi:NADH:ubiquinone oxidoreductase [Adlercreutzia sp. R7]|uniref:NADH:ubiquinone oxidoreductase n=1 Tax=Adlercreutzia wanghongyangiae TaxID=3111451 RepID=A0ABU6IGA0_9ACTN|nr:NADH:ubiquinone oxidoreductase [Adlercreutzia sp. R7]
MSEIRTIPEGGRAPRVVLIGLASCFGCQINITNIEEHLLAVLGQVDMAYWQLTSSEPMPDEFDVAVIEGAVTTEEAAETVRRARERATCVIAIGACAATGGIPGMAAADLDGHVRAVYGDAAPAACGDLRAPVPVSAVADVDFTVSCCPIDPLEFVRVLDAALYGSNALPATSVLCGECSRNEQGCFYGRDTMCLGLVTRSGCGAKCPAMGRPCNGCAGLSPDANVQAARYVVGKRGLEVRRFDDALEMFNAVALGAAGEE